MGTPTSFTRKPDRMPLPIGTADLCPVLSAHVIGQPWSRSTAKGRRWADFGLPNRGKDRQRWHGGMSGHGGLHKRRAVRARRTYTSLRCHNFTCTMRTTAHRTVPWGNPAVPSFPPLLATVVGAYWRGVKAPAV